MRVGRSVFPAPLDLPLAVLLSGSRADLIEKHDVALSLERDGTTLSRLNAELPAPEQPGIDMAEGEEAHWPLVLPTQGFPLDAPGRYILAIDLDGQRVSEIVFLAYSSHDPPPPIG